MEIVPNPAAEVDAGFDLAKPGNYKLRIEGSANFQAVSEFTSKSGNQCIKIRLVFADPTGVYTLKNEPAKNLGSIIDASLVISPADKQGKLRSLVESAGLVWANFTNTDMLVGCEVNATVAIEDYNGAQKNVVKRYLKPGA
jgi:hypothetical protein